MTARRWLVAALAAAALLLILGRIAAGLYVDYGWYQAMNATAVWRARMLNQFVMRGASGLLGTLFVLVNLYAVRHSVVSLVLPRRVANLEIGEEVPSRYLLAAVVVLSVFFGALLTLPHNDWTTLTLARSGVPFREPDPYFQGDLGFYVYWLPFETSLHLWALIALLVVATIVVFLYALTPSLRWERGTLHVSGYVRRHLSVLGALLLFLLAWSYRLDAYGLLLDGSGPNGEFVRIDHTLGIPVNLVLAFVTGAAALLVLWSGWTGQMRIAFGAVTMVLVLSLGLRQLLPPLVARLGGGPVDPEERERAYVATRAGYTRRAYAVDELIANDSSVAFAALRDVARSASAWDTPALLRAVERTRRQRANGDVGWRSDEGRNLATLALPPAGPDASDPYTPWSVARVRAYATDERGAYVAPERAASEEIPVAAALVHDSAVGPLIIGDRGDAFAAPEIASTRSLLAHAWAQQNPRLIVRELPYASPRIMLRRDVRERVRGVVPFFKQGTEITPIVVRDSLYWALHLYSWSAFYPLSQRFTVAEQEVSYLKHSAIAVVDAHTGRLAVVIDSVLDPIAATWRRRFPTLFSSRSSLARDLAAALPPAVDGAHAQALAFARVGARGDLVPAAHLPRTYGGDTVISAAPVALHASPDRMTVAWTVPVLDAEDRVRGLVVAAGGAPSRVHWRPLAGTGPRWQSVLDRLHRVSDSTGPTRDVRRGRVRAIPLAGGIAFVQSSYVWRSDGPPTVARVAVLANDTIFSGATFAEAVGAGGAEPGTAGPPTTLAEFRARADKLYQAMRDALRQGDLAAFAEAYEQLGRLLRPQR